MNNKIWRKKKENELSALVFDDLYVKLSSLSLKRIHQEETD